MEANAIFLLTSLLLSAAAPAPLEESQAASIFVAPFAAGGEEVAAADLHRIAEELFLHDLAATRKFTFAGAATEPGVELVVSGTLRHDASGYLLELVVRQGAEERRISSGVKESLDATVEEAAAAIASTQRRTGYVVKRQGDRIVIARGSEDGIAVGQRYRTSEGEEFEIVRVAPHTADGQITGRTAAVPAVPGTGASPEGTKLGARPDDGVRAVDVVFVIDTTGSMQEEIDGVLANCRRLVEGLSGRGIDASLSLVTFRVGVEDIKGPTGSAATFRSWLAPLRAGGGGDETPFGALQRSTDLRFRPGARRVFVLITDEPAYDALAGLPAAGLSGCLPGASKQEPAVSVWEVGLARKVSNLLTASETVVFAATLDDTHGIYRELARRTGGTFYDLERSQDFTALLDKLGKRIEGMFMEL